jgi:nicotinate-nucleotide adenylyltransferase
MTEAIGLLGGTFDPIHFGHLRTALELREALELSEVRLIPCYLPVHRKIPIASAIDRLEMVKCAIEKENDLVADDCEIKRKAPSYSIDTVLELKKKYPGRPLCLIMGIDALLGFPSWHRYEDILSEAHLIIAHRPQYQLPKTGIVADLLKQRLKHHSDALKDKKGGNIMLHPVTPLEISATDIRKQIAIGKNPRFLLPDRVYEYIQINGVYALDRV